MSIVEPTGLAPALPAPVRHSSLRVVAPRKEVDLPAAQRAVADLRPTRCTAHPLRGLGDRFAG